MREWSRKARRSGEKKISTAADLKRFFAECRRQEKEREPDWKDHLRTIELSRNQGRSDT